MPERFRKSWGAHLTSAAAAEFRLWAPDEKIVRVILNGAAHEMRRLEGGWFEVTAEARAGDRYWFQLSDGTAVADPASCAQEGDVDGPSIIVDQSAYRWKTTSWRGRPWEEAVIYELHVGTFTPEGTFRAAVERLPHLADAGITAIEIMPVAQFHGSRGWGYDGVLHYAPHQIYGTPDDLKALVDTAHALGIMVLLDVVYNHFGPEGNALPRYAAGFFNKDRPTPWGASIAFEQHAVRRYFIENALCWLGDFRFDGLRFDATEQIRDSTHPHFLIALARELRETFAGREIHLVVEDADRRRSLVGRSATGKAELFTAGWNDDFHNALHVVATGEINGHYRPFADDPWRKLRDAMTKGFASPARGMEILPLRTNARVSPQARVNFLQNHDQVGNRAFGDRLATLVDEATMRVMTAMLMLVPQIPLIFMGDEYGESQPFLFFSDFRGEIGKAIRLGRREEAENFGGIPQGKTVEDLPDPLHVQAFFDSKLRWQRAASAAGKRHIAFMRDLVDVRQQHIVPLLIDPGLSGYRVFPTQDGIVAADWLFGDASLELRINLSTEPGPIPAIHGRPIFMSGISPGETVPDELPGPAIIAAVRRG